MNSPSSDQLAWLALQYICDELESAERDAFESRLQHDQAAREAVAAAVETCAAVRIALGTGALDLPTPVRHAANWGANLADDEAALPAELSPANRVTTRNAAWRRSLTAISWMVSGAAACLLALMLLQDSGDKPPQTALSEAELAERQALAQAYAASDYLSDPLLPWSARTGGETLNGRETLGGRLPSLVQGQIVNGPLQDGIAPRALPGLWTGSPGADAYLYSSESDLNPGFDGSFAQDLDNGLDSALDSTLDSTLVERPLARADDWMLALFAVEGESPAPPDDEY